MVSKHMKVVGSQGFHMRPASVFAAAMGKFQSDVTIKCKGESINGKSLMNLIAAGIKCGAEIEVVCSGPDENEAMARAAELIESGFGE